MVSILQNGCEIGSVHVREEGLYLRFSARTQCRLAGICRAYLRFENGEKLLGVMEPSPGGMSCTRCFAKQQLRALGALRFVTLRTEEEKCWQAYDGRLPGSFAARLPQAGILQRREEDTLLLALPYRTDAPFPLTELFCFASVSHIDGRDYIVYRFSDKGTPKM